MATPSEAGGEERRQAAGHTKLQCLVVTPEKTLLDETADFVALPLYDGELGILPGRAPLIGRLGYGELRTRTDQTIHRYFVDGGFAQVRDDVVTVLTNRAVPADQIDPAAASRELEHAQETRALTDDEFAAKLKAMTRARALLRIGEHKSSS
jgi:F-type H+-transporting ATPase subunit epsilon